MTTFRNVLPVLLWPWAILVIPLGAMILRVEGWAWGQGSFLLAWALLSGVGLAYRVATRNAGDWRYRAAAGLALVGGLVLVWINGAVGLIGSEVNPANLIYAGVLGVGLVGVAISQLRPQGMAKAMAAMSLAQFLVPWIALTVWPSGFSPGVVPVFGLNGIFVALFAGSALLFSKSARDEAAI